MKTILQLGTTFLVLMIGIPFFLTIWNIDDQFLDDTLGDASILFKYAGPKNNIKDKQISAGFFKSSTYLETSILEPLSSSIKTSKGTFVVGQVSAFHGDLVELKGLTDKRLQNKLCIGEKCYKLLSTPSISGNI